MRTISHVSQDLSRRKSKRHRRAGNSLRRQAIGTRLRRKVLVHLEKHKLDVFARTRDLQKGIHVRLVARWSASSFRSRQIIGAVDDNEAVPMLLVIVRATRQQRVDLDRDVLLDRCRLDSSSLVGESLPDRRTSNARRNVALVMLLVVPLD